MSAPERIWAWPWEVNPNMGQWETQQSIWGEGTEYIRADAVAEMIRQAVQAEREACAVITETMHETSWPDTIAAAIRARGDA